MAKKIVPVNYSREDLALLQEVSIDVFKFAELAFIRHPVRGRVNFKLYPYQKKVLWYFLTRRFNIVLKFRQAGLTELIALFVLWFAMYHPNKNIQIISIKDRVAKRVLGRIKYIYKNLPIILQTPIVNGRPGDLGTNCITPDTVIVGREKDFKIGDIIPKKKGILDVEDENIHVLTHKGKFQRVLRTINKGVLETWEIQDEKGNTLKCTPHHRLYTPQGWKTVEEIVKDNLNIITWDTAYLQGVKPNTTEKPTKEIIKATKYPGYFVSNLGKVYSNKNPRKELAFLQPRPTGTILRVKLTTPEGRYQVTVSRLIWETFVGDIPKGFIIDHIDNNSRHNWLTNLQCITYSQNTKKAYGDNRVLVNNNFLPSYFSLKDIGLIKSLIKLKKHSYGYYRDIAETLGIPENRRKRVSNIANGKVFSHINVSKIKVIRKYFDTICDMEVEEDHSYITKSSFINHNTEMEFSNGSMITSIPTTEDAGRSEAVSLLVIDEAAIVRWATKIWAAAFPTLSCLTRNSKILVRETKGPNAYKAKYLKIGDIAPDKGQINIEDLGLEAFTHLGNWKPITHSLYKGHLETWKLEDESGNILNCTPAHRFLTPLGWKSAKDVISNNLKILQLNFHQPIAPPKTTAPTKEIIEPIDGFDGYYISNLGKVYSDKKGTLIEVAQRVNQGGYLRVGLRKGERRETGSLSNRQKSKTFQKTISKLVAEAFIGEVPDGYQVDHINCVRTDNYSTNLQIIPISENVKRTFLNNINANITTQSGKKMPNLEIVGRIIEELAKGNTSSKELSIELSKEFNKKLSSKFISKWKKKLQKGKIKLTTLSLKKKYLADIVDIHVKDDHSYITKNGWVNHNTGGSAIINSCVTGDTMVIGKSRNFRMDSIAPKEFGKKDISHLGLEVLSHTGKWQKVIGSVNKGKLETWEIENRFGDRLKCTPHHKLLTSQGWKSVKEIVEKNLRVIVYKSGLDELLPLPITTPPAIEEIKPIKGFPNYAVSNLGKVYITKAGKYLEKQARPNNRKVASGKNYISISLWANNKRVKKGLHNLIAEAFIGDIPEGYVVDHLNGNPEDNYVTNLEIVSIAENTRRATLYSRGLKLGSKIGKGFPNLQLIAKIREKYKAYGKKYGVDLIIEECYRETGIKVTRAFISRIINKKRTNTVQISKLKVIRKYLDNIYDISVENDQSYITVSNYVNHNTPFGIGNWYHQTWTEALNGSNGFNPIRLKWPMHPERDLAWYNSMKAVLGPKRTAQEIDGDFLASGDSVFDLLDIKAIEDTLEDYDVERKMNGSLLIFKKAPKHVRFWIGADIASGRSRDYSTFSIMDRYGEEYACFKGKIPPDRFADLLMRMGKDYNFATIAPEGNDIGLSTVHRIQNEGYPKLYYTVRLLKEKGEKKPKQEKIPGWLTTSKNRPVILDELETDIRNDEVTIKNPFFVSEAYTFIYDERNRPVAMGKEKKRGAQDEELEDTSFSDDAIFGESITNFVRKGKVNSVVVAPA